MGKSEPDWRCPTRSAREDASSLRLCSFVGTPARNGNEDDPNPSTGAPEFGGNGKKSRTMTDSSPEVVDRLADGINQARDAKSEEEDELGCGSDEPPSAEVDESLIKSGVPMSERSGVDDSVMGENWEGWDALPTYSKAVLSINSRSRELHFLVVPTLSSETLEALHCSLAGRLVAGPLTPGRGGKGGTRETPSQLLIPEYCRVGDFMTEMSPTGKIAESMRVIRRDT